VVGTRRATLMASQSVTLGATGGQLSVGPDSSAGPANWLVTGVIVKTTRPGVAPIPAVDIYRDTADASNLIGTHYDGSRGSGSCEELITRGQRILAVWTGGQAGDVATLIVSGQKW
jgi:hypothetical protein